LADKGIVEGIVVFGFFFGVVVMVAKKVSKILPESRQINRLYSNGKTAAAMERARLLERELLLRRNELGHGLMVSRAPESSSSRRRLEARFLAVNQQLEALSRFIRGKPKRA
jgi:hypothetical protein